MPDSLALDLMKADVQSLPYADDSFDAAFAIHCIYFWPERAACLREMRARVAAGQRRRHHHSPGPSVARAQAAR